MKLFRRLDLFLILLLLVSTCSFTSSQDDAPAKHELSCQGSVMSLRCQNRSFVITISSAIYGRNLPGSIVCPNTDQVISDELMCREDVFDLVKERCDGKMNCTIPINKKTLMEPCKNVYKYLEVSYKCEDAVLRGIRDALSKQRNLTTPRVATTTTTTTLAPQTTSTSAAPTTDHVTTDQPITVKELRTTSRQTTANRATSPHHSVSDDVTTASTTNIFTSKLRSTLQPTRKQAPGKPTEHKPKGSLRTIKLFHFLLSFQVVREGYLKSHPASSFVWFLCGVLGGLHVLIAVFYCLHRRKPRRRRPEGKSENISYMKHKLALDGETDEKAELRPNEAEGEAMEMTQTV